MKKTSPSFVLSLELEENPLIFSVIEDELEICRVMYNTILGKYLKLEDQMKREKTFKRLIRQYKAVAKMLEKNPKDKHLKTEKKTIQEELKILREKYQLTEYSSHEWVKPIRKHFGDKVNAAVAQKIATRAWNTFSDKLFGKAKRVHFVRKGEMKSFEGKTNTTGWRIIDGFVVYKHLSAALKVKPEDHYVSDVFRKLDEKTPFSYEKGKETINDTHRIKYVRIVKKVIRRKNRYFADIVIAGFPPSKSKGLGKGRVGIDIGTSTAGVSSLRKVVLVNLADQVKDISREIKLKQRKMDRSKRAMNPDNFNDNGTIRKGKKTWVFSYRYKNLRFEWKELHRKRAEIRKLSHRRLINQLLTLGDAFFVETMNFKSLQKRKKETEISGKTGKYKRKKRFGKTLGNRAPAMFINILEEKVKRHGGSFQEVNTQKFKASQYCHIRHGYFKKPLSERWHIIDEGIKIQRDLYSAFLLMNSTKSGIKANQRGCEETFPLFQKLHDLEITEILKQKKMILNSGIIVKN